METMSVSSSRGSETGADRSVVQQRRNDDYFQSNNEARNSVTSNTEGYGDEFEIPVYDFETSENPVMSEKLDSSGILTSKEKKGSDGLTREESSEYGTGVGFIGGLADLEETIFVTGSSYEGTWDALGMSGVGRYVMPNGTIYEGEMRDGMFHGHGSLYWSDNQRLDVVHVRGELREHKYNYSDGLTYDEENWSYCKFPDRRFYESMKNGLRPGGRTLKTAKQPTKILPAGCYDTGDGIFDPKTHHVTSYDDSNKILRSASPEEYQWIVKNCRRSWTKPTGYRPELNENWSKNPPKLPYNLPMSQDSPDDWWRRLTTFAKDRSFLESARDSSIGHKEFQPPEVCMCGRYVIIGQPCRCVRTSVSSQTEEGSEKLKISVTTDEERHRASIDEKKLFRESSEGSQLAGTARSLARFKSSPQEVKRKKHFFKKARRDDDDDSIGGESSAFPVLKFSRKKGKKFVGKRHKMDEEFDDEGLEESDKKSDDYEDEIGEESSELVTLKIKRDKEKKTEKREKSEKFDEASLEKSLEESIDKSESLMRQRISDEDKIYEKNAYGASTRSSENVQLSANADTENVIGKEKFGPTSEEGFDRASELTPGEKVSGAVEPEIGDVTESETKLLPEDGPEKESDQVPEVTEEKKSRPDLPSQVEKNLETNEARDDIEIETTPSGLTRKSLEDVDEKSMDSRSNFAKNNEESAEEASRREKSVEKASKKETEKKSNISQISEKTATEKATSSSSKDEISSKKPVTTDETLEKKLKDKIKKMDERSVEAPIRTDDRDALDADSETLESKTTKSGESTKKSSKLEPLETPGEKIGKISDKKAEGWMIEGREFEQSIGESEEEMGKIMQRSRSKTSSGKNVISSTFGSAEASEMGISSPEESFSVSKFVDNEGSSSAFISTRLGRVESSLASENDLASLDEVHPSLATIVPMKHQESSVDERTDEIRNKRPSEEKREFEPMVEDLLFHPALTAPRSENVKYVRKPCDLKACKPAIREVRTAGSRTRNDLGSVCKNPKQLSAPNRSTGKK